MKKEDSLGHELLDPTPRQVPVRMRGEEPLRDQVRRFIREEASAAAASAGYGTFEEEDDFEIDDDYDPTSPHELSLEQELYGRYPEHGRGSGGPSPRASWADQDGEGEGGVDEEPQDDPGSDAPPRRNKQPAGGGGGRSSAKKNKGSKLKSE